jgi:hypothetical protein
VILVTAYPHRQRVHLHRPRVNPWLVAVSGLAAALIALGAWVIVDRTSGGGGVATSNATALIDKWLVTANGNDATAISALLTRDAGFFQRGASVIGANAIAKGIASQGGGKAMTRIAPVTVNGDYATTFIHFYIPGVLEDWSQLEVFKFQDGKIAGIWGFLLGETAPFDPFFGS